MKLAVQVKLLPSPEAAVALSATLRACNAAANRASHLAFGTGKRSRNELQREVYAALKADFGLSAQAVVRTVKKTVDAYTTLKANIQAGNLGPAGVKRRVTAESKPIAFRPDAAQPYDDRILSWQHDAGTVSIWTVHGRIKGVRCTGHPDQLTTLAACRTGETDLVHRDGQWFLVAVCEVPAPPPYEPVDWIGVDRGIANLLLAVPPARCLLGVQVPPGRGAVLGGGCQVHLAEVSQVRAHRAGQPAHPGSFPMSSVRARWPGRPRRRGQRAHPRTLGVGVRQHARIARDPAPPLPCGRCDP